MFAIRSFSRCFAARSISTLSQADKHNAFFALPKFAVIGASDNSNKWGSKIYSWFQDAQLAVTPVNPRLQALDTPNFVGNISDLASPTKTGVVVVTQPSVTLSVLKDAKAALVPVIWLQEGTTDSSVMSFISQNNMQNQVVLDSTIDAAPAQAEPIATSSSIGSLQPSSSRSSRSPVPNSFLSQPTPTPTTEPILSDVGPRCSLRIHLDNIIARHQSASPYDASLAPNVSTNVSTLATSATAGSARASLDTLGRKARKARHSSDSPTAASELSGNVPVGQEIPGLP